MNITELRRELERILTEHGDLEVEIESSSGEYEPYVFDRLVRTTYQTLVLTSKWGAEELERRGRVA